MQVKEFFFPSREAEPIQLAGKLHVFEDDRLRPAVLLCHPSSRGECDMEHGVIQKFGQVLNAEGFITMRFNFRGNAPSEGPLMAGRGELADVLGALDVLDQVPAIDRRALFIVGHSFGAAMSLKAAIDDDRIKGVVAISMPMFSRDRLGSFEFRGYGLDCEPIKQSPKPKLFITGTEDRFCPPATLEQAYSEAVEPKRLAIIQGADHFYGQPARHPVLDHPKLIELAEVVRSEVVAWADAARQAPTKAGGAK